ncbi:MAG: ParB-like nuclease domain-containing protein [Clostridia bacterium]|nr:ParB-like nuclease domain-containing protein [Clostridia bacterium]
MSVGKGSLQRAVSAKSKTTEKEQTVNAVVDFEIENLVFKETPCDEMIESVKNYGVIVPVVLAKDKSGVKVVDGAKRITALKALGEKTVKAVVLERGAKSVKSELDKFGKKTAADDIHEKKFEAIKRLGEEEMPFYLL